MGWVTMFPIVRSRGVLWMTETVSTTVLRTKLGERAAGTLPVSIAYPGLAGLGSGAERILTKCVQCASQTLRYVMRVYTPCVGLRRSLASVLD
jgi:hypothetical protein